VDEFRATCAEKFGEFIAIMWVCWNSSNESIFRSSFLLASNIVANALWRIFRQLWTTLLCLGNLPTSTTWRPPSAGVVKINFDAAKLGTCGRGWAAVARDASEGLLFAAVGQSCCFMCLEVEEANACRFTLKQALAPSVHADRDRRWQRKYYLKAKICFTHAKWISEREIGLLMP